MINQFLMAEFTQEAASTRRMLQAIPEEQSDWKPHGKSMTLRRLASHVANIPKWIGHVLNEDSYDFMSGVYKEGNVATKEELLQVFDANCQLALQALEKTTDETFHGTWSLRRGEQVIYTFPKIAAIRTMAMNHQLHHRGQLSVYLRLLDVKVPGMYGPSADDK